MDNAEKILKDLFYHLYNEDYIERYLEGYRSWPKVIKSQNLCDFVRSNDIPEVLNILDFKRRWRKEKLHTSDWGVKFTKEAVKHSLEYMLKNNNRRIDLLKKIKKSIRREKRRKIINSVIKEITPMFFTTLKMKRRKVELELEIEALETKKKNFTLESQGEIAKLKADHEVELKRAKGDFDVEKSAWDAQKKREVENMKEDHERAITELTSQHKIALAEALQVNKVETKNKIIKLTADYEKKIVDQEAKFARDYAKKEKALREELYKELSSELTDIHKNGNVASKNMQELMMGIVNNGSKMNKVTTENFNFNGEVPRSLEGTTVNVNNEK